MIGQQHLIAQLKSSSAQSILITGPAHWGKKTLLRELFGNNESVYEISGNAAAFREALERIYSTVRPTIYLIPDIDKCNATIQNLLLKVLEEPPKSATFYLTASGQVLPTIVSRCVSYRMEPYQDTNAELGGLETRPALLGMYKSPGQLALINLEGIENLTQFLQELRKSLDEGATLAFILKQARNIQRLATDLNLTQAGYLILLEHIFGATSALEWLRAQPNDAIRYIRTEYFMRLWLERQVGI